MNDAKTERKKADAFDARVAELVLAGTARLLAEQIAAFEVDGSDVTIVDES